MKHRILGLGVALLGACTALSGCETLRHNVRQASYEPSGGDDEESPKLGAVKSQPPKGFFQSSRLPGAMSSEGRDVERNLGIN
jgi:hypothetical protein